MNLYCCPNCNKYHHAPSLICSCTCCHLSLPKKLEITKFKNTAKFIQSLRDRENKKLPINE